MKLVDFASIGFLLKVYLASRIPKLCGLNMIILAMAAIVGLVAIYKWL